MQHLTIVTIHPLIPPCEYIVDNEVATRLLTWWMQTTPETETMMIAFAHAEPSTPILVPDTVREGLLLLARSKIVSLSLQGTTWTSPNTKSSPPQPTSPETPSPEPSPTIE